MADAAPGIKIFTSEKNIFPVAAIRNTCRKIYRGIPERLSVPAAPLLRAKHLPPGAAAIRRRRLSQWGD